MDEASIPEQSGPARARDDSPYTASSMSRLRLADLAMHIADRAFALVSVERDEVDSPARATALVETARVVEQFAAELLDAAAIHARTAGATWDDIGDAAELPRQDASVRFGPAAAAWHERSTSRDGLPRALLYRSPKHLAAHLDRWAAEHRVPTPRENDEPAVSAGLRRLDAADELALLRAATGTRIRADDLSLRDLAAIRAREAELLTRLADDPHTAHHRADADTARAQADDLARRLAAADAVANKAARTANQTDGDEPPAWATAVLPQMTQALRELPRGDNTGDPATP